MPVTVILAILLMICFFGVILLPVMLLNSIKLIGPAEVGLVTKRFGKKLPDDNPIALSGEAGYQADLLMPGLRFVFWPVFSIRKYPWVQIPAGEIGVVVSQTGRSLPIGAKSAKYKPEFGNFTNTRAFIEQGGEKGVQRPVLPPGTLVPIHPVAFLVITREQVYGHPVSPELERRTDKEGRLSCTAFGLTPDQLMLVRIEPHPTQGQGILDMVGIVTTYEGDPLPSGLIASRLGDFQDVSAMEKGGAKDSDIVEILLGNKKQYPQQLSGLPGFSR